MAKALHCSYCRLSSENFLQGETYLAIILALAKERCWMVNHTVIQVLLSPVPQRQINTQMKFSLCWRIHNSYTLRWSCIYYRSDRGNSSSIDRPEGVAFTSREQLPSQIKKVRRFRSRGRESAEGTGGTFVQGIVTSGGPALFITFIMIHIVNTRDEQCTIICVCLFNQLNYLYLYHANGK